MTPKQFAKRFQLQLLKVEREQAKLHAMAEEGLKAFGPGMGVDIAPFSGGTPKQLPGQN